MAGLKVKEKWNETPGLDLKGKFNTATEFDLSIAVFVNLV